MADSKNANLSKNVNLGNGVAIPIEARPIPDYFKSPYPDQIAENLFEQVKSILKKHKELTPVVFGVSEENGLLFTLGMPEPEHREALVHFLKLGASKLHLDCVAIVSEAWMSSSSTEEEAKHARPSQDPNRKETVCIYVAMAVGTRASRLAILKRGEDGFVTDYLDVDGQPAPFGVEADDGRSWIDEVFAA
jgi:hypothetical protein